MEFFGPKDCFVPALPTPRTGHVTFVAGGAVACCGGWTGGGRSQDCVVLNTTAQQWSHGVMGDLVWTIGMMFNRRSI